MAGDSEPKLASTQDDLFVFRILSQFLRLYVIPDLEARIRSRVISSGALPLEVRGFRVSQRRQEDGRVSSVVELNEEVELTIQTKSTRPIRPGDALTLADIHPAECYIEPPQHNEKPLGYFLYVRQFLDHRVLFDFTPNSLGVADGAEVSSLRLKYPVAEIVKAAEFHDAISPHQQLTVLADANWPPAPGYYPSVMWRVHADPRIIQSERFVDIVAAAYDRHYWQRRLNLWRETGFYSNRLPYLETAINRYFEDDFISSTYVIVPQFEGIIKAYLDHCSVRPESRFDDCAEQLKQLLRSRKVILFPDRVLTAIFDYLVNGAFWKNSRRIDDPTDSVNRHGLLHGIFTGFECRRVSLKYLILLDALDYVLLHDKILTGEL